jgi:Protein of unknown function (DUF1570)
MFALLLALAVAGDSRPLDTVELEGGSKLQGRVVFEDQEEIVLRVGTNERTILRKKVVRVDSRCAELRGIRQRWRGLAETDLSGTLALARECREKKLEEEAQLLAWYVLSLAPKDAAAHEFLGHEKRGEGWLVADGARRWPYEKLLELRKQWKDAWEIASEHYRVRTNVPLHDAVIAVLEMESAYEAFHELLGRPLRFRELVEPLEAQVHADQKSFPETAGDARSYFDHTTHVLFVNSAGGFERGAVAHEATHQLLDACIRSTRSARGDVPGWLDEGLAEYIRASTGGPAGRSLGVAAQFDLARFQEHAQAKSPYDLSRVLNFGPDDFFGSTKSSLKYSQSYTLVCWGLYGDQGRLRPRFFEYLKEACKGHSSSTAFKAELKLDDAAIEKGWAAFVRAQTGGK